MNQRRFAANTMYRDRQFSSQAHFSCLRREVAREKVARLSLEKDVSAQGKGRNNQLACKPFEALPETGSSTLTNGDTTPDTVAGAADRPIPPLTIRGAQAIVAHLTTVNVGCRWFLSGMAL
jgi:hypothetical protein